MKVSYGSYSINHDTYDITTGKSKYAVTFYNPLTKKQEYDGLQETEELAIKRLQELNFEFFSNNSSMLPKSISVNRERKCYTFSITINGKKKYVAKHENLDEIVRLRNEFVLNILN